MKRLLIFIFILPNILFAQRLFTLEVRSNDQNKVIDKISYKRSFASKTERSKEIRNVLFSLYDNAYLAAEIISPSSPAQDTLHLVVYVNAGEQYKWAHLKKGNVDEGTLSEIGFREKIYQDKPVSYKEVRKIHEKILTYCENNGYPFASVKLDSIQITNSNGSSSISALLHLEKNNLIRIDSVMNHGNLSISGIYLQSYLSIHNGGLYNEALVKKIGTRVKELPFAKETIPFRILFTEEKAKVELFLEKKRASQFDGILGMLPDNKTGKILFTGDVRLKLNNSFNRGELLELNWRRLQAGTQDLKTRFVFPFLLKSPFGIDINFKLYKKDSTYLEVNPNFGIQYHLAGTDYIKVFVNKRQMSLINTKGLQYLPTLPSYADMTSTLYGLSLKSERLDYRLNPRKGYSILATAGAGNKVIKKNDKLNQEIYKGMTLNTAQYNAELEAAIFIPIKNKSTIRIGTNSAYLQNSTLFQNELFRFGGFKTLRGFDEETIIASSYYIFSVEYRYLLEENSYLYFFGDGAYYENKSISYTGDRYDTPYGFGSGISFETKAGIFSISYALGKQFDNPINFRSGKVHFGIVNYF